MPGSGAGTVASFDVWLDVKELLNSSAIDTAESVSHTLGKHHTYPKKGKHFNRVFLQGFSDNSAIILRL